MTAQQALDMATRNGAIALGLEEEIGSIEPGKKADLVLFDLEQPHLYPMHHVPSGLVYQSNGSEVRRVWVDGELLLADGKLTWISPEDERRILKEAQAASAGVVQRADLKMA